MVRSTWTELLEGERPLHTELLRAYRAKVGALPDVEERISRTSIGYARKRGFTSAYVKSGYLEVGIELLREASHPRLRTAFATTKKVWMHRFSLTSADQLDELDELFAEAADTVGPGTR